MIVMDVRRTANKERDVPEKNRDVPEKNRDVPEMIQAVPDKIAASSMVCSNSALQRKFPIRQDLLTCGVDITNLKFDPQFDKFYVRANHPEANYSHWRTSWKGELKGSNGYFCPVGWRRFSLQVNQHDAYFHCTFKNSQIMYHGTQTSAVAPIIIRGFIPHGCGQKFKAVYLSPSILYSAHPRFANVVRAGSIYFQVVLKVRVASSLVQRVAVNSRHGGFIGETMGVKQEFQIDPNFDKENTGMEFVFKSTKGHVRPSDGLMVTGIMMRTLHSDPIDLQESKWWTCYDSSDKLHSIFYSTVPSLSEKD